MEKRLHPTTIFRSLFLVAALVSVQFPALAQFNTAIQDGIISANEYGTHANGQNQQSDGGTTYFMSWDANNLYLAFSGSNFNEAATIYLDYNPVIPVNGGTNADGSVQGLYTYDRNHMMLPFRADFVLYFKNGYNEYRRLDGAGYWGGNTAFALATGNNGSTNTCEIAIPWNTITGGIGRPAQFNWLGYKTYDYGPGTNGVYSHLPIGNPNCACNQDPSRLFPTRYFNVLNTANGTSTAPFSTVSFNYYQDNSVAGSGGYYQNGGTFHDFTVNDNSLDNNDNAPAFHLYDNNEISNRVLLDGNITINHNLYVGQGSTLLPANNTPAAVTANLTFAGSNGSIYNYGRIDPNPEAVNINDWNNRRINFIFAGTTRIMPSNLFKDLWRLSNVTVNAGASLLGPAVDSTSLEVQWGTWNNLGTVDFGDGTAGFADVGTRGDWSQHNDYFLTGTGIWRMHQVLIGRNSSRLQPAVGGTAVRLLVQGDFENYDEFLGRIGAARIDVVMAGKFRQYLRGNVTETAGAATSFYNFEVDNSNMLADYNNSADVWFLSFGGGNITYYVTGNLTLRNGDLVTRHRVSNLVHDFILRDSATVTPTFVHSNLSPLGSSFVDGPLKWEIQQATVVNRGFPVGKTKTVFGTAIGDARPVVLTVQHDAPTRTTYTSEMFLDDRSLTYAWPSPFPEIIAWISQQRYWNISKGAGANVVAAQVTLSYDVMQRVDGVNNSPALRIVKDNGAGQWLNIAPLGPGGSANNTGFITSHPFTAFSDFTLASIDGNMPLPVELLSFEAMPENRMVRLDWQTSSEVNTSAFVLEASSDRAQFHEIGRVAAAGNSESPLNYRFWDAQPIEGAPVLYYRLKIIDLDGNFGYSQIRSVVLEEGHQPQLLLYPNPSEGNVMLELIGANDLSVNGL
ncbi:MAG TPA: hypothetical protein VHS96_15595, partial [Bacteroidia bacterium]|nr:hypothetical protein [Bacteroidia bacterium]